jgi:hypothetical protein
MWLHLRLLRKSTWISKLFNWRSINFWNLRNNDGKNFKGLKRPYIKYWFNPVSKTKSDIWWDFHFNRTVPYYIVISKQRLTEKSSTPGFQFWWGSLWGEKGTGAELQQCQAGQQQVLTDSLIVSNSLFRLSDNQTRTIDTGMIWPKTFRFCGNLTRKWSDCLATPALLCLTPWV